MRQGDDKEKSGHLFAAFQKAVSPPSTPWEFSQRSFASNVNIAGFHSLVSCTLQAPLLKWKNLKAKAKGSFWLKTARARVANKYTSYCVLPTLTEASSFAAALQMREGEKRLRWFRWFSREGREGQRRKGDEIIVHFGSRVLPFNFGFWLRIEYSLAVIVRGWTLKLVFKDKAPWTLTQTACPEPNLGTVKQIYNPGRLKIDGDTCRFGKRQILQLTQHQSWALSVINREWH